MMEGGNPMHISRPNRITRTYVQRLSAPPETVFPLLCPVRETEWAVGWHPRQVFSHSGLAEADCVFVTESSPSDTIWYVTRHEPGSWSLEMVRITPGVTACKLQIQLSPTAWGCDATVTYSHTSLGPAGDAFAAAFTEAAYENMMKAWESQLNHFLRTGTRQPQ
jgi:hypothetical protein